MKLGRASIENSREVTQKLKIEPPHDPAISALSIYPKDMTSPCQGEMQAHVTAILFTIAKTEKQPKCPPSADKENET